MTEERICSVGDVPPGEARAFALGNLAIAVVRIAVPIRPLEEGFHVNRAWLLSLAIVLNEARTVEVVSVIGSNFRVASVMMPSIPSEPTISDVRLNPTTFFSTFPPNTLAVSCAP